MSKHSKKIPVKPVRETSSDYDKIGEYIADLLKDKIYDPLLSDFNRTPGQPSPRNLVEAISTGRIYYEQGQFKGQFSSPISRELRALGAKWGGKQGSFSIPLSRLPLPVRSAIEKAYTDFQDTMRRVQETMDKLRPGELAQHLKLESVFDQTLFKVDKALHKSLDGLVITQKLTESQRARIAREYTGNMSLAIEGLAQSEIKALRKKIEKHTLEGLRYQGLEKTIVKQYGVSKAKARFIARQETSLFISKFKQTRYQEAGVDEYIWRCVVGSPNHPVRPMHKKNDGKTFTWSNPPVVDEQGHRKNPGEDFNCRCTAVPLVSKSP